MGLSAATQALYESANQHVQTIWSLWCLLGLIILLQPLVATGLFGPRKEADSA